MAENEYENALGLDLGLNGKILSLFILIGSKKNKAISTQEMGSSTTTTT